MLGWMGWDGMGMGIQDVVNLSRPLDSGCTCSVPETLTSRPNEDDNVKLAGLARCYRPSSRWGQMGILRTRLHPKFHISLHPVLNTANPPSNATPIILSLPTRGIPVPSPSQTKHPSPTHLPHDPESI